MSSGRNVVLVNGREGSSGVKGQQRGHTVNSDHGGHAESTLRIARDTAMRRKRVLADRLGCVPRARFSAHVTTSDHSTDTSRVDVAQAGSVVRSFYSRVASKGSAGTPPKSV